MKLSHIYEEIQALKKEQNAVILAHYYVPGEVQACADYIGDSFYLSKIAAALDASVIVFAGVTFMGESAKILSPEKTVLLPDGTADCSMACMASVDRIKEMREKYEDLAVVCYINSTAEIKAASDVCVTSANAVKIVRNLPNHNIYFIPDGNLGAYVAKQVPEKNVIPGDGYCYVHHELTVGQVEDAKKLHPDAEVLTHPECREEILALSDFIGSTSAIIDYASNSTKKEFIILTENGVFHKLKEKNPDKEFYPVSGGQKCVSMKKITLEKVRDCLRNHTGEVFLDNSLTQTCRIPLKRMLDYGKQAE